MKHGKGTFRWPDGSVYTGDFKDEMKDGVGTFVWGQMEEGKTNHSYEGQWVRDMKEGSGKEIFTNGDV